MRVQVHRACGRARPARTSGGALQHPQDGRTRIFARSHLQGQGVRPRGGGPFPLPRHGVKILPRGKTLFPPRWADFCASARSRTKNLVAVTAAMKDGVGLSEVSQKFPDRCFDVGICEEYAVTMAAGMAKGRTSARGLRVFHLFAEGVRSDRARRVPAKPARHFLYRPRGVRGRGRKDAPGTFGRSVPARRPQSAHLCAQRLRGTCRRVRFCAHRRRAVRHPIPQRVCAQSGRNAKNFRVLSVGKRFRTATASVVLACGARAVARALDAKRLSGTNCMVVNCRTVKPPDERLLREVSHRKDHRL